MPELPEVETVRKTLLKKLKDKKIIDVNLLYPKMFEGNKNLIINKTIKDIKRRGKWLIFDLGDLYLLSHLRMEGKYFYRNFNDELNKHDLVIFNINNEFELRYNDTRRFGKMYLINKKDIDISPISKLGLEPFDSNLNVAYLKEKYKTKNLPIKSTLLEQDIISGIGNIYANEILFLSKINPYKQAKYLNDKDLLNIINNTKTVLNSAIKKGGTTIRSYTSEEGVSGKFQNDLYVHSREFEKCKICKSTIKREKINGRSTFYCPNCQKNTC